MSKPKTIKIDEQEYVRASDIQVSKLDMADVIPAEKAPYAVGKCYLIRTVTMALLGRLESVGVQEMVLTEAGWLADTGRFHDCLKNCEVKEFEPSAKPEDQIIVNRQAIIDVWPWHGELPGEQK